jgi:hypothetical protein
MANNNGFGDTAGRLDFDGGATGTQRRRPTDPTGQPFAANPQTVLRAETRMNQYRHGGWDKYEVPTDSDGAMPTGELPEFFARGGNAGGGQDSAAYPGGTVA